MDYILIVERRIKPAWWARYKWIVDTYHSNYTSANEQIEFRLREDHRLKKSDFRIVQQQVFI